jgi:hypothetical protein
MIAELTGAKDDAAESRPSADAKDDKPFKACFLHLGVQKYIN